LLLNDVLPLQLSAFRCTGKSLYPQQTFNEQKPNFPFVELMYRRCMNQKDQKSKASLGFLRPYLKITIIIIITIIITIIIIITNIIIITIIIVTIIIIHHQTPQVYLRCRNENRLSHTQSGCKRVKPFVEGKSAKSMKPNRSSYGLHEKLFCTYTCTTTEKQKHKYMQVLQQKKIKTNANRIS
ncbi:hypothetical protein STEG23_004138, partial [Scotinomys teguina]